MDCRATVDAPPAGLTVRAEQAIFTSIPSPMARGYRIIASSPGLTAEERQEIVQCAPSHAALCDDGPEGQALASFTLRSGRHCLFLSHNAGAEHTGRGGARVHTHVLVLEPAVLARFAFDPLAVEAAAQLAAAGSPSTQTPQTTTRVEPVELLPLPLPADDAGLEAAEVARLLPILARLLAQERCVVSAAPAAVIPLRRVLDALPAAFRTTLSLSHGLKPAPTRSYQLVFTAASAAEITRMRFAEGGAVCDWSAAPGKAESAFRAWLDFVARRWQAGEHEGLRALTDKLAEERTVDALASVAALCDDAPRLEQAELPELDELVRKHAGTAPGGGLHARLLKEFRAAAEARRAALEAAAAGATDD